MRPRTTDDELLISPDPEAFGIFYARHLAQVEAYFARRVGREPAGDLAAETFACALVARRRFTPGEVPALGWLFTIAARRLVDFHRRNATEMRIRETLAAQSAGDRARIAPPAALTDDLDVGLLRHLPIDQREALKARFAADREYAEIAGGSHVSEASIRQRVSRGLSALRAPLRIYRAAQELARQDRAYRFGGGHGMPLDQLQPHEPLDCSSSASLLLQHAGVLVPGPAWTSGRLAADWGQPGEGRYVTVWANDDHVWIEFKLDADHGERFDPTPSRLAPHSGHLRTAAGPTHDFTPRHQAGL